MTDYIKETILFVDDDEHVLDAICKNLRNEPYNIITVNNPSEALIVIEQQPIALVVADYLMPGMNGIAFLLKTKEISPTTMRLIMSGHKDFNMAITAINKGEIYRFITKPTNIEEIKITINQALEYRRVISENKKLKEEVKQQAAHIGNLENLYPGIMELKKDENGAIIITD